MAHRNDNHGSPAHDAGERAQEAAHDTDRDASSPRDTLPSVVNPKQTLPTGAAFHATWKLPAFRPSAPVTGAGTSGVRRLDLAADSAAHRDRDSLARTLRMEVGLPAPPPTSRGPHNEPRDTLEPVAPISPTRRAAFSRSDDRVRADAMQRVGDSPTTETTSERPAASRTTDPFGRHATEHDLRDLSPPAAGIPRVDPTPPSAAAASEPAQPAPRTGQRPWGEVQPHYDYTYEYDEATLGSRAGRAGRTSSRWPLAWWLAAAAFAVAVGFVLLLPESDDELAVDEAVDEYEATEGALLAAPPAEGQPHLVTPAPLPGTPTEGAAVASALAGAAPAAATQSTTELITTPAMAEVVRSGAVVANTPARVPRTEHDVDYLVRLRGYDSQLVRVGPSSPAQISLRLLPTPTDSANRPDPERASAPEPTPEPQPR